MEENSHIAGHIFGANVIFVYCGFIFMMLVAKVEKRYLRI